MATARIRNEKLTWGELRKYGLDRNPAIAPNSDGISTILMPRMWIAMRSSFVGVFISTLCPPMIEML